MDANGTAWRMRSLVAMGHDATRMARAMDVAPDLVRRLIRGDCRIVTVAFHLLACQLREAWWDKRPPVRAAAERQAASRARRQAESHGWPAAAGWTRTCSTAPATGPRAVTARPPGPAPPPTSRHPTRGTVGSQAGKLLKPHESGPICRGLQVRRHVAGLIPNRRSALRTSRSGSERNAIRVGAIEPDGTGCSR